ncbi:acyltransferase domain-containing protein [Streptomyces coeruleoprunus]|uniref:Acyltransferase domain-containing protein n=1 Tax=Streptomyces coeruleoprunus TaxID=285563 RepID=A0ABV9XR27_9ACTN
MTADALAALRADDLADALLDLAVPHEDVNPLLAVRERLLNDPVLLPRLERDVRSLVDGIGHVGSRRRVEPVPPGADAAERYFPVLVCLAALPAVRAYHRRRAVPDGVSRRTLADLGRHMALHRRSRGNGGLRHPGWLQLHFRGELYQLGRLQFQRDRLRSRIGTAVGAAGLPYRTGDHCLSVHIPDFLGPLTPAACDASVDRARAFFARHFPEEEYELAICESWLLDPQLRGRLPRGANVLRFQDRFRLASREDGGGEPGPGDARVIEFVFGDPGLRPAELAPRTTLERAVVGHLLAGGHWYERGGWFTL